MVNESKLRELFDAKLKSVDPNLHLLAEFYKRKFFEWFKFGFAAAYPPLVTLKTSDPLTPEKREAILKQHSKLIFVYSWCSAQQRTMIILADSREEADSIFKAPFEDCAESPDHFIPAHYVTQLFVDGGDSTIIYNN